MQIEKRLSVHMIRAIYDSRYAWCIICDVYQLSRGSIFTPVNLRHILHYSSRYIDIEIDAAFSRGDAFFYFPKTRTQYISMHITHVCMTFSPMFVHQPRDFQFIARVMQ